MKASQTSLHYAWVVLGALVVGLPVHRSYSWAFISAALLAFLAVPMALAIRDAPASRKLRATPAPAALPVRAS
jgi:hypothetical protein